MIDREARDRLADLLERLLRHDLPIVKFEDAILMGKFRASADRSVADVASAVDDIGAHVAALRDEVLAPPRFSDTTIQNAKRCAQFLRSDLEYEWPPFVARRWGDESGFPIFLVGLSSIASWIIGFQFGSMFLIVVLNILSAVLGFYFQGEIRKQALKHLYQRHRSEGREPDAWPFVCWSDVQISSIELMAPDATSPAARKV